MQIPSLMVFAISWATLAGCGSRAQDAVSAELPECLSETGLYEDSAMQLVAHDVLPFEPQYPLWSDGATKRRWIRLPAGTWIDGTDPDAWVFPVGTRLWKEFTLERRIETRYLEKLADGSWRRASYVWNLAQSEARLAPGIGVRGAAESAPGVPYDIPSRADCEVCHARGDGVLGFSALQLSPDRDPNALHSTARTDHGIDLSGLVERGLLRNFPPHLLDPAPRIEAATPRERAVLGYLHANCGSCHTDTGLLAGLRLTLDAPVGTDGSRVRTTTIELPSRYCPGDSQDPHPVRIRAGEPHASTLLERLASRAPAAQMPPLGTHLVDHEATALVEAWIREDLTDRTRRSTTEGAPQPIEPKL